MRNHNCENYAECLNIAAKGNFDFSCIGCDGQTIVTKEKPQSKQYTGKKRGPKPKGGINRARVYVDFTNYPDLYEMLLEEAAKEFRTLSMQLLYYINKGCDLKKK